MPALRVNLGVVSFSLGSYGPAGMGIYRTSGWSSRLQADEIRDGMRNFLGKVKQGVDIGYNSPNLCVSSRGAESSAESN